MAAKKVFFWGVAWHRLTMLCLYLEQEAQVA